MISNNPSKGVVVGNGNSKFKLKCNVSKTRQITTFISGILLLQVVLSFYSFRIMPETDDNLDSVLPTKKVPEQQRKQHPAINMACFAMITEKDITQNKAMNTLEGWGHSSCTEFVFFKSELGDNHEDIITFNYTDKVSGEARHSQARIVDIMRKNEDNYEAVGKKSWLCWKHMLQHYLGKVDFIMKADPDTYIIVPNLMKYIAGFNASVPAYIGKRLKEGGDEEKTFVAGAATILSHGALLSLNTSMIKDKNGVGYKKCCSHQYWGFKGHADDVALGDCMKEQGIEPIDTRDDEGKERFMVFNPSKMANEQMNNKSGFWYHEFSYNPWFGERCCSAQAISFHYVLTEQIKEQTLVYEDGIWTWLKP